MLRVHQRNLVFKNALGNKVFLKVVQNLSNRARVYKRINYTSKLRASERNLFCTNGCSNQVVFKVVQCLPNRAERVRECTWGSTTHASWEYTRETFWHQDIERSSNFKVSVTPFQIELQEYTRESTTQARRLTERHQKNGDHLIQGSVCQM